MPPEIGIRHFSGAALDATFEGDAKTHLRALCNRLNFALPEPSIQRLIDFVWLLERWNKTYNLTALRTPRQMLDGHVVDALVAAAHLPVLAPDARILDVGSGAGVPAIVWAIAFGQRFRITSVDSVEKKIAFQHQACAELALSQLEPVHARIEQYQPPHRFDLITARAFAPLPKLIALTRHLVADAGMWAALKTDAVETAPDELSKLPSSVRLRQIIKLQVAGVSADRRNLVILEPSEAVSR